MNDDEKDPRIFAKNRCAHEGTIEHEYEWDVEASRLAEVQNKYARAGWESEIEPTKEGHDPLADGERTFNVSFSRIVCNCNPTKKRTK